jgi:hypothetical protein
MPCFNLLLIDPLRLLYLPRPTLMNAMPVLPLGDIRIDPGSSPAAGAGQESEIVVVLTDPAVTREVLARVPPLAAGMNAHVRLLAVHTLPYQAPFYCPSLTHAYLVEQVMDLASECELPIEPQVVLARSREEGLRHALTARSMVVLGSRRRWWRTQEESTAAWLEREGYRVALLHFPPPAK